MDGRNNSVNSVIVRVDQKLERMTETNRGILKNLLFKINPNGNVTEQLNDMLLIIEGKANPNGMDLVFKANVDSVLEGIDDDTKSNDLAVVVRFLANMQNKNFQNMMVTYVIEQLQSAYVRSTSMVSDLVNSATGRRRGGLGGAQFSVIGNDGVPNYDSNRSNNRTTSRTNTSGDSRQMNFLSSQMNQLQRMLFDQQFDNALENDPNSVATATYEYNQPTQPQLPTIIKERVVYPEQSVYSGYGRPKMMTEIEPHKKRADKPPACIPQEKMPRGPVPLQEYANASDYTGVGSMLPVFVYDETYDNKYYKRLYDN